MKRDCCQWLADLRSGVASVQESAWTDLSRTAFQVACTYLHRRADVAESEIGQLAEDVTQEALMDILNGLDSFRGESKFTTWMYGFVVNNARELLRKRNPPEPYWPSLDGDERAMLLEILPDSRGCDPELEAEEEDLVRVAQEVINTRLTERQRVVLLLYQAGHSPSAIAERVGTTRNNVDQLLHVARKRLKSELHGRGYGIGRTDV
jgi:RNA polymerase sigma-70 factor (ECF subfamily)